MRIRLKLLHFIVGSMMMMVALSARAEKYNCYMSIPPGGACCFQFVLAGNQTCNLNTSSEATDGLVNPFAYNGGSSSVSVSYDPNSNTTTVTICGAPIQPGQTFHYPPGGTGGNGQPHIGLDGGNNGAMTVLSGNWISCPSPSPTPISTRSFSLRSALPMPSPTPVASPTPVPSPTPSCASNTKVPLPPATTNTLPMLSLATTQVPGPNPVYYTLYLTGTDANGNAVGGWHQQPYPAGTTPSFQIVNNTGGPVTISSVGFITNDSQRALNTLNFGTLSPPGNEGSPFSTPGTSLEGTVIPSGGSIQAPNQ